MLTITNGIVALVVEDKMQSKMKCICSTCLQVANIEVGSEHIDCIGIDINVLQSLPSSMKGLVNPLRKGKWMKYE